MEKFGKLAKAVVAVGSWNPANSELQQALDPSERRALVEAGSALRSAPPCSTTWDT
jgi:hypothetical protein